MVKEAYHSYRRLGLKKKTKKKTPFLLFIQTELSKHVFFSHSFSFRMRVKKLPKILALHLKRFKYMEQLQRYTKLSYRVVFPFELRLFNTVSSNISMEKPSVSQVMF